MPTPPQTSIILVTHNSAPFINACLDALFAQEGPRFEVLVVDNQSTDRSIPLLEAYGPRLRLIRSAQNLGYAGAINLALTSAQGEFIAPLNIDTVVQKGWLNYQVDFLMQNPHVGAVTPMILLADDPQRINAVGAHLHLSGLSFCRDLGASKASAGPLPFPVAGLSGASYLMRKSTLKAMDGAPAWCFMANDDVILSWILQLMDLPIYCVPQAQVLHHYHLSMDAKKLHLLERNRLHLILSTLKKRTLIATLPAHLALEMAIFAYCALKGRPYWMAKKSAITRLWHERALLRTLRQRHQRLRTISDATLLRRLHWRLPLSQLLTISGKTKARQR